MSESPDPTGPRPAWLRSWPAVGLLVAVCALCQISFASRAKEIGRKHVLLDERACYTPTEACDLLDAIGPRGRAVYAASELTLDVAFLAAYGCLFAVLTLNMYPPWAGRALAAVPVVAAFADLCENGVVVYLVCTFNSSVDPVAWAAALATVVKRCAFGVALAVIVFGATVWPILRVPRATHRPPIGQA